MADGSPLEQCKIPWPFPSGSSIRCDKINDQAPVTFTGLNTSSLFLGVMCRIVTRLSPATRAEQSIPLPPICTRLE